MEEKEKVVNDAEEATTSAEEQASTQEQVEDTTTATPEQEKTEPTQTQEQGKDAQVEAVDERGVPWKNVAMEWQRKFQEVANEETLEKVAQRVLEQYKQQQQPQREYTIAELEQFAIEHPQYRPWVEEQKLAILEKRTSRLAEEKVKEVEKKNQEAITRQQAEQWVVNHPRLQECFISDPLGKKVWNFQHPLTQLISVYMKEPELQKRPDGLMIAAKLALADYMDAQLNNTQKKTKALQQNLKKVQKATLVEGGSPQEDVIKSKSKYQKAFEAFRSTGSKDALKEVLKTKLGIEE